MAISHYYWHLVVKNGNFTLLLTSSGQQWQFLVFKSKPRHVTPQIDHLGKSSPVLWVSTHIYRVSKEIDGKMFIFYRTPRHVTPQINCLGKTSPVLRVSTHIYRVSKDIDGKTFTFTVHLGMWPLKSIVLEKWAMFWGFQHTFMGFLRR